MKNFLKRKKNAGSGQEVPARITNETVAEHREQVLAGGRKFKYPLQYQKHKLVINSLIIGIIAVIALTVLGWQQLYVNQNTSKLIYRITQLVPVVVASVDGEDVRYSDYLMRYRSSIFYLEKQNSINLNTADGKRQSEFYKRQELENAEKSAYVSKLARQNKISVSDEEVMRFITEDIEARSVSLNAYEKTVLNSYYDWSLDEYKGIVRAEILKRKVGFVVDKAAQTEAGSLLKSVNSGADFATVAKTSSDDDLTKDIGGDSGVLPVSSLDPNRLISAANKLNPNQISELIQGTDGYYFIKLLAKDKDTVRYQVVKVALTAIDTQFEALKKSGKIKEFINVQK